MTSNGSRQNGARRHANRSRDGRHAPFLVAPFDRFALLITALISVAILLPPPPIKAQSAPLLSHSYTYGQTATFRMRFVDTPNCEQATLLLQINGIATDSQTVDVEAGAAVVVRDLASHPLPPFAELTYWWTFETTEGHWIETEKQLFQYADNRFTWRTVANDTIHVHWITGESSLVTNVLDVAETALMDIGAALQVPTEQEVDIYIYPSETDLASALRLGGHTWVSGVTYPQLGVILVAIPPNDAALAAIQHTIPHELTHKALYDSLGAQGYASLPTWLNEGLATFFEARPDPDYAQALQMAHDTNTLMPLGELCAPFPDEAVRARLAYAQSGSLVRYLRQQYGWSRIRELLAAYADGMACSAGAQIALGLDLTQLEREWLVWIDQSDQQAAASATWSSMRLLIRDTAPWLMVLGALLVAPLLILITGRRH